MTNAEMLTELGYNLDDPSAHRYTAAIKLSALNKVLSTVAAQADTRLLRGMQSDTTMVCVAIGNTLPTDYFRYVNSSLYLLSPIRWITKVEADDLGNIMENYYTKGSDADPLCYIWGGKYYLAVTTYTGDSAKTKLYYLKNPTAIIATGTCDLHSILHEPLMLLAEADLRETYKYGDPASILAKREEAKKLLAEANAKAKRGELIV